MSRRARRTEAPDVLVRGDLYDLDRVAFIHVPHLDQPIRVRVRFDGRGTPWRCDACGPARLPACTHAQLVADQILRDLLDDTDDTD